MSFGTEIFNNQWRLGSFFVLCLIAPTGLLAESPTDSFTQSFNCQKALNRVGHPPYASGTTQEESMWLTSNRDASGFPTSFYIHDAKSLYECQLPTPSETTTREDARTNGKFVRKVYPISVMTPGRIAKSAEPPGSVDAIMPTFRLEIEREVGADEKAISPLEETFLQERAVLDRVVETRFQEISWTPELLNRYNGGLSSEIEKTLKVEKHQSETRLRAIVRFRPNPKKGRLYSGKQKEKYIKEEIKELKELLSMAKICKANSNADLVGKARQLEFEMERLLAKWTSIQPPPTPPAVQDPAVKSEKPVPK